MSIILGIDPGSRVTGFGVVEFDGVKLRHINHGVIVLDPEKDFSERLKDLGESMREVLAKYKPQHVSIEKIFLGKNADSAFKLGHARGVCMYESAMAGAHVAEYATRVIKKSITGLGSAEKEQVQMMVMRLLQIDRINRLDASDALALACHHAYEVQNLVKFKKMKEVSL